MIYSNFILIPILITFFGIFFGLFNNSKYFVPISSYFYLALPFYILIYLNKYYLDGKIILFWLFCIVEVAIWIQEVFLHIFCLTIGPELRIKLIVIRSIFRITKHLLFLLLFGLAKLQIDRLEPPYFVVESCLLGLKIKL